HWVDPRVLERGPGEPWRVPAERFEHRADHDDPKAEAAGHDRAPPGLVQLADSVAYLLGPLPDRRPGPATDCLPPAAPPGGPRLPATARRARRPGWARPWPAGAPRR